MTDPGFLKSFEQFEHQEIAQKFAAGTKAENLAFGVSDYVKYREYIELLGFTECHYDSFSLFTTRDEFTKFLRGNEFPVIQEYSYQGFFRYLDSIVGFSYNSNGVSIEIRSNTLEGLGKAADLLKDFTRVVCSVEWVYSPDGSSTDVAISSERQPSKSFYPFIPTKTLEEYYDTYMESSASILLLIGPPGTGKTSFLRGLMQHTKKSAMVSYDPQILEKDSIFANFIDSEKSFLILEDADNFLAPRKEGNSMMHRFLNVGDGLVTSKKKKMIFSTNLPSIKNIDSALTRPGRCYDVLYFRELTGAEADAVRAEHNLATNGKPGSLGEIFAGKRIEAVSAPKVGFY